jgi:hypothetical protein
MAQYHEGQEVEIIEVYASLTARKTEVRVARYEASGFIEWRSPTPLADRRGDLVHLLGTVRAGIASIWHKRSN